VPCFRLQSPESEWT